MGNVLWGLKICRHVGQCGASGKVMAITELTSLLEHLGPDLEQATQRYLEIRKKLERFFEYRGLSSEAQELTDRALDILAQKLQSQAIQEVNQYVLGIAKMVARKGEAKNRKRMDIDLLKKLGGGDGPPDEQIEQQKIRAMLRKCMARLDPLDRALILAYYPDDAADLEQKRQAIARSLLITTDVLRTRICRIKDRIRQRWWLIEDERSPGQARR